MFIQSNDSLKIYFEISGSGPVILLLHGFGNDHSMWIESGWIEKLETEFTVVTMDYRGCGKSDKPDTENAYSIENHCSDIDKILAITNSKNPIIWGWSLGATLATHYAASRSIRAAIVCGSYFGLIFSDEFVNKHTSETTDIINVSRLKAFNKWPIILPKQINSPFLVYTGTNDGNVVIQLRKQQNDIENANGRVIIFDGLNHWGLIKDINKVENVVMEFLYRNN